MKKIYLLLLLLLSLSGTTMAQDQPKQIELSPEEREMVAKNNDFAFQLLRTVRDQNDEKSLVLSPLSQNWQEPGLYIRNGRKVTVK